MEAVSKLCVAARHSSISSTHVPRASQTRSSSLMSHPITQSILNAYFSRVYSLRAYLDTILVPQDPTQVNDVLLLPADPPSYGQFLSQSYVAFSGEGPPSGQPQFIMTQSFDSMRVVRLVPSLTSASSNEEPQVITRAQERLFSGPKQKGANVITMGYRGVCPFCGSDRCIL
jgi:hypothetical protein